MSGSLAVDAGQTGTRLRFTDPTQTQTHTAPGVLTDRPLMPQVAAAVIDVVTAQHLFPDQVAVGCSGVVTPQADELLDLLKPHGVTQVAVAHDAITSYLGALGDRPGVMIAAGTGVVTLALGHGGPGRTGLARVDGWGYLLGDSGSGFGIGQAGMRAALRAFDGRGQDTVLSELMAAQFPDLACAYIELQSDPRRVSRIAAFAQTVDAAAAADDPVAQQILDQAAAELSESVMAGLTRVHLISEVPPPICAMGKVFDSPHLHERFIANLRRQWPGLHLTPAAGTAVDGAAALLWLPHSSPLSTRVGRATLR